MKHSPRAFLLTILLALPSSGCGGSSLQSGWVDHDVTVDGNLQEWQGQLTWFEDADVDLGVLNDDQYLYVSIVTASREVQRQIHMRGLIVWLDPTADEKKTFGIHYPLGLEPADLTGSDLPRMPGRNEPSAEERQRLRALFEASLDELEILHGEGPGKRMDLASATGIDVRVTSGAASLTYELRIPLRQLAENAHSVGANPGQKMCVGIATPKIDREALLAQFGGPDGPGTGRPAGGIGPMGGDGPRGGRGPGGPRPGMPEPIDAWATIQLASLGDEPGE